jgi:hypothetical protein
MSLGLVVISKHIQIPRPAIWSINMAPFHQLLLCVCSTMAVGLLVGAASCTPSRDLSIGVNEYDLATDTVLAAAPFQCGGVQSDAPMISGVFTAGQAGQYLFSSWPGYDDVDTVMEIRTGPLWCTGAQQDCNDNPAHIISSAAALVTMAEGDTVTVNLAKQNGESYQDAAPAILVSRNQTCQPLATLSLNEPYEAPTRLQDLQYYGMANNDCFGRPVAQVMTFTAPFDAWYVFYTNITSERDDTMLNIRFDNCTGERVECNDDISDAGVTGTGLLETASWTNVSLAKQQTVYVLLAPFGSFVSPSVTVNVVASNTLASTIAPTSPGATPKPTMLSGAGQHHLCVLIRSLMILSLAAAIT